MNFYINSKRCFFFSLGRHAMYAGCRLLGLKAGDEVLTPAFDCDGTLQPFKVLGLNLKFFRIHPYTLEVDLDDLSKKISSKTKLIHIINYFGIPQPWDCLQSLKERWGIPVLEDNAHSLFSAYQGKRLGTFGDISIFSLRKNLLLPDGALLQINTPSLSYSKIKKSPWLYKEQFPEILRYLKGSLGISSVSPILKKILRYLKEDILPPPPLYSDSNREIPIWPFRDQIGKEFSVDYERPMSQFSLYRLNKTEKEIYSNLIQAKQEAYTFLSRSLKDVPQIRILHPVLKSDVVPFCFSFLVNSKRDKLWEKLKWKYEVMIWPTLSSEILLQLQNFPEVEFLGRHLLQLSLPSHKVIKPAFKKHLEKFVSDVLTFSKQTVQKGSDARHPRSGD